MPRRQLARLEGQVVLPTLFTRFADIRLAEPPGSIRQLRADHPLRGPERLLVTFSPIDDEGTGEAATGR